MAEQIISPGVFTRENDLSFLPQGVGQIGAAVIGPTVKGPAGVPTVVSSYSEYQQIFGDTFSSGSGTSEGSYAYLTSYTAKEYLKHADTLTVVRILAGDYAKGIDSGIIEIVVIGDNVNINYLDNIKLKIKDKISRAVNFIIDNKLPKDGIVLYKKEL